MSKEQDAELRKKLEKLCSLNMPIHPEHEIDKRNLVNGIMQLIKSDSRKSVEEAETSKVDRLEVIDDTGRAYVKGSIYGTPVSVELSYQDEGRTLKVFVTQLSRPNTNSEYEKYKLYRGGVYVGYVAIYKRGHKLIRALFEQAHGAIYPQLSHYVNVREPQEDGTYQSRGEGRYLAHFDIEAAQEDVHLLDSERSE